MRNKIIYFYFLFLLASSLLFVPDSLLFADESITLSTYYPSPYGSYNNLTVANNLDVNSTLSMKGIATAPDVSASGQGRIYFDSTANKFKASENGGAYAGLGGVNIASATTAAAFSTSSTVYVDITGVTITRTYPGGNVFAFFEDRVDISAPAVDTLGYVRLLIDGVQYDMTYTRTEAGYHLNGNLVCSWAGNLNAGSHTIKAQAAVSAASSTLTTQAGSSRLTVIY